MGGQGRGEGRGREGRVREGRRGEGEGRIGKGRGGQDRGGGENAFLMVESLNVAWALKVTGYSFFLCQCHARPLLL